MIPAVADFAVIYKSAQITVCSVRLFVIKFDISVFKNCNADKTAISSEYPSAVPCAVSSANDGKAHIIEKAKIKTVIFLLILCLPIII